MRRRVLTVRAVQQVDLIQPKPDIPADDVAAAFRTYERAWRAAQGDLADRLERGEITSEAMAAEWFGAANLQARKDSFLPLLRAESVAFGGDSWTAKKQAAWIRRYSNAGK
jgi:hypothetical protein